MPFYAAPMGMTVRISEKRAFEPDALVASLPRPQPTDLEIPNPVIVVEVLSPPTARRDWTDKLAGYFNVSSIQHYLIVDPEVHEVNWYRRAAGGAHAPPVRHRHGTLQLDPPGITLEFADLFSAE